MLEYWLGDLIDVRVVDNLGAPFSISLIPIGFSSISILFFSISSAAMMPVFFFFFIRFGISIMIAATTMSARRPATPPTAITATMLVERPPSLLSGPDIAIERRCLALANMRLVGATEQDNDNRRKFEQWSL